jgi:hypothetical protein
VEAYVSNRKDILDEARERYRCSRQAAKELFLRLLNGGNEAYWLKDEDDKTGEPWVPVAVQRDIARGALDHIDMVEELKADYAQIRRALYTQYDARVDELRVQLSHANPGRNKSAIERSVFSTLLQDIERQCLDAMMESLSGLGYETCCKIYDGCLVRAMPDSAIVPHQVLEQAEGAILAKTKIHMRCWEKCLLCGETLVGCVCPARESN